MKHVPVGTSVLDGPSVTGGLLRFGHARVLTRPRRVIHCPRAASLPRRSVNRRLSLPLFCKVFLHFVNQNPSSRTAEDVGPYEFV